MVSVPRTTLHSLEQWRETSHSVEKSARGRMIAAQRKLGRRKTVADDTVTNVAVSLGEISARRTVAEFESGVGCVD